MFARAPPTWYGSGGTGWPAWPARWKCPPTRAVVRRRDPQAARIPIFLGISLVLILVLAVVLVIMVMTGSRRALLDSGTYATGSYRTDDV